MIKTQIQMPDYLYKEVKRIAEEYEMSLAEVVRRGIERVIPAYPSKKTRQTWDVPSLKLGLKEDPFLDPNWREKLNVPENDRD